LVRQPAMVLEVEYHDALERIVRREAAAPRWQLLNMKAHEQAGLKYDHSPGRHRNLLAGFRISSSAWRPLLDFENAEVAQLNRFAFFQAVDDMRKRPLQDAFDVDLR